MKIYANRFSSLLLAFLFALVTASSIGCSDEVEAFLMGLALDGTWETVCRDTGGQSIIEEYVFDASTANDGTFSYTVDRWTSDDCTTDPLTPLVVVGTYTVGDEVDCTSGYDGVCVELDLNATTPDDPIDYVLFSIDPDLVPEELYLSAVASTPGDRADDVDTVPAFLLQAAAP